MAEIPSLFPGTDLSQASSEIPSLFPDQARQSTSQAAPSNFDWLDKINLGIGHGLAHDVIGGGAQLLTRGLESAANTIVPDSGAARWMTGQREDVERRNQAMRDVYQSQIGPQGSTIADLSRIGGNIFGTLPIGMVFPGSGILSAGASGAASGTLQPVENGDNYWRQKATQAGLGGILGAGGNVIAKGISRAISPQPSNAVQTLINEGVQLTPGQRLGGVAQTLESASTSIPVMGDVVKGAQTRSVESFNRAAINKALAPIGEKLDEGTPLGREAAAEMQDKIGKVFDNIRPRLGVTIDNQFAQDVNAASGGVPASQIENFKRIIKNEIMDRIASNGSISGQDFKLLETSLGQKANQYLHSAIGSERELGSALQSAQDALRDLLGRTDPSIAMELAQARRAYAIATRINSAASSQGTKEGVFTPAQLSAAVRRGDSTLGKRAYARGDAMLQGLSDAAKKVLPATVPDSGTPLRSALIGAGALLAGHAVSPEAAIAAGTGGAIGSALYSPPGQWLMRKLLTERPTWAPQAAQGLLNLAPAIGVSGGPLAAGLLQ